MKKVLAALGAALVIVSLMVAPVTGNGNGQPSSPPGQDECDRGNSTATCRPDPQPSHGQDCEEHGNQGGINEDHCTSPSPETTPTPTPEVTPSATSTPSPSPLATPTLTPVPTPEPTPTPSVSASPNATPSSQPSTEPSPSTLGSPSTEPTTPAPYVTLPPTDSAVVTQVGTFSSDGILLALLGLTLIAIAAIGEARHRRNGRDLIMKDQ